MNWAGLSVFVGLVTVGIFTWPYGIVILAFLAYLFYKS